MYLVTTYSMNGQYSRIIKSGSEGGLWEIAYIVKGKSVVYHKTSKLDELYTPAYV